MSSFKQTQRLRKIILDLLEKKSYTRQELLSLAVKSYGVDKNAADSNLIDSDYNKARSLAGTLIAGLIKFNSVIENEDGTLTLIKEKLVAIEEAQCESYIRKLIDGRAMYRADIYSRLEKLLGTDKTFSRLDDLNVRQVAGNVLKRLLSDGTIIKTDDGFILKTIAVLNRDFSENETGDLNLLFLKRLHSFGGEFLERFAVNLMIKYYQSIGITINSGRVVGGSADGGIDGIIETTDFLGFKEIVMLQTKCRERIFVTEKEIREFYGAVCAKKGTRGIFVTTSTFHINAQKYLQGIDNCIGIDGRKLFQLALKCRYGIKSVKGGFTIDEAVLCV